MYVPIYCAFYIVNNLLVNLYVTALNYFPRYRDSPFEDRNNFGFSGGKGSGIDDLLGNKSSMTSSSSWENEFDKSKSSSGVSSSSSLGSMSSSNKGKMSG